MRKSVRIVARESSGTCCARMRMMEGQKAPTHASKQQKASSCT